jgi:hypothetical protein
MLSPLFWPIPVIEDLFSESQPNPTSLVPSPLVASIITLQLEFTEKLAGCRF